MNVVSLANQGATPTYMAKVEKKEQRIENVIILP
jgi:hypothetical protein